MSRWFKYVFIAMILFVVRMGIKMNSGSGEPEESLYVTEFYEQFEADYEAALDKYGGEHVVVEGEIFDVVETEDNFVIYVSDGSDEPMIEAYPTKLRPYSINNYGPGQYIVVRGKVLEDQEADWVTMKHCQLF